MTAESTTTVLVESYVDNLIKSRWPKLILPVMQERALSASVLKIEESHERGKLQSKTYSIKRTDSNELNAKMEISEYRPKLYLFDGFIHLNALDKALVLVILAQRAGGKNSPLIEMRVRQDADKTRREVDFFLGELYGNKSQMMELMDNYFG